MPTLYCPNQAAFSKGWTLVNVCHFGAAAATSPGAVTLCRTERGEYVTHWFNKEDGGFHTGHYYTDPELAHEDWMERIRRR